MKFKEYVEGLVEFSEAHPECADLEVITSKDDEGNGYNRICCLPTKGIFDGGDYQTEREGYSINDEDYNAVCVN